MSSNPLLHPSTRDALRSALKLARAHGSAELECAHLLYGLLTVTDSDAARTLNRFGMTAQFVQALIEGRRERRTDTGPVTATRSAAGAANAVHSSGRLAAFLSDEAGVTAAVPSGGNGDASTVFVHPHHLLLAVLRCDDVRVNEILAAIGALPERVEAELEAARPELVAADHIDWFASPFDGASDLPAALGHPGPASGGTDRQDTPERPISHSTPRHRPDPNEVFDQDAPQPAMAAAGPSRPDRHDASSSRRASTRSVMLEKFGTDMVAAAAGYDPVVGRDDELERVIVSLARRTKNNPVLVGEPGVGKTAVVEALAARIAAGHVPEVLTGRPLISLDLAAMMAGARLRGDLEERLQALLAEARDTEAILFLDEIHQVVGAGASGGGIGIADTLKPMLARGEISLIGATTLEEYRKHIETDAALERRFQPVRVNEPTLEQATTILTRIAPTYAEHHQVTYTPEAVTAAVTLSARYITDRFLPDKAIDVLDEAGAAATMRALRSGAAVHTFLTTRSALRSQLELAERNGYRESALKVLRQRLLDHESAAPAAAAQVSRVDVDDIAAVISAATGVPLSTMGAAATERLRTMADRLRARVIGQDAAVEAVCRAVRRTRQGLAEASRPASFVFAGPTGVGKSELAKALADDLFGTDAEGRGTLIQLDMSEYAEKNTTARLFGAPPGYVGYDEGGQLTERVRRNPYSVLLLDEVEKAHPDVFDALLQVLEDGRMTDSTGRVVDFSNTVIILTTNLGAVRAGAGPLGFATRQGAASTETAARATRDALKEHFRPEFLNRIDEVVVFTPLERSHLAQVVERMLAPVREQLADLGVDLAVTDPAVEHLLAAGWEPAYGARPLRRAVTRLLVDPLSEELLRGTLTPGSVALADAVPTASGDARGKDEPLGITIVPAATPAVPISATDATDANDTGNGPATTSAGHPVPAPGVALPAAS